MRRLLVLMVLCLPSAGVAERVITRSGAVIEGESRIEGDFVVVRRPDGSEVRIRRGQVERIELTPEERAGRVRPRPPPPSRPPPRAPAPSRSRSRFAPASPPPEIRSAASANGLALSFGYHRGLSVGLEWQTHLHPLLTLGVAGQVGAELVRPEGSLFTWGVDGRVYVGRHDRFVGEVGIGLNLAKVLPCSGVDCPAFVRNVGPEMAAGFQHMSHSGFFFEVLGGVAFATEPRIRADREISPTFQASVGFLFH